MYPETTAFKSTRPSGSGDLPSTQQDTVTLVSLLSNRGWLCRLAGTAKGNPRWDRDFFKYLSNLELARCDWRAKKKSILWLIFSS
jgi:hypothetical protein